MRKTPQQFNARNQQKQRIEFGDKKYYSCQSNVKNVEVGDVWWYHEGMNIGHEQSKGTESNFRRVGIILSNRVGSHLTLLVPLTTKVKPTNTYHLPIQNATSFGLKPGAILLNQFKIIDRKRLIEKVPLKKQLSKKFIQLIKKKCWELVK